MEGSDGSSQLARIAAALERVASSLEFLERSAAMRAPVASLEVRRAGTDLVRVPEPEAFRELELLARLVPSYWEEPRLGPAFLRLETNHGADLPSYGIMPHMSALERYEGLPSVFANEQRVAIAAHVLQFAIQPPPSFTVDDVVRRFDGVVPKTSVANALRNLETLGMVLPKEGPTYDRRKHLQCDVAHPFWPVVSAAVDAARPVE